MFLHVPKQVKKGCFAEYAHDSVSLFSRVFHPVHSISQHSENTSSGTGIMKTPKIHVLSTVFFTSQTTQNASFLGPHFMPVFHDFGVFLDTKKTRSVLGFASKTPFFYHRSKREKHCFWCVFPYYNTSDHTPSHHGCTRARAYITYSDRHKYTPQTKTPPDHEPMSNLGEKCVLGKTCFYLYPVCHGIRV